MSGDHERDRKSSGSNPPATPSWLEARSKARTELDRSLARTLVPWTGGLAGGLAAVLFAVWTVFKDLGNQSEPIALTLLAVWAVSVLSVFVGLEIRRFVLRTNALQALVRAEREFDVLLADKQARIEEVETENRQLQARLLAMEAFIALNAATAKPTRTPTRPKREQSP